VKPPSVEIVFFAPRLDGSGEDLLPLLGLGDAATSQRHRISATMASHDVEEGAEITDHYRRNRDPLVFSVVVSNAPLEGGDVELTRVEDAWALLNRAADEALEAVVTTRLGTFDGRYLDEVTTEHTAADRSWMRLELTFMPIRKVTTELVEDVTPDRDRRPRNAGAVALQDPTATESALYSATGGDPRRIGSALRLEGLL
jgi:hypothetical protein